ncbi:MAG: universal stress protein [Labilithrix sp.]|nr:universal stress protein [Labilithrix sp.]MCW5815251.1 universal stress protein [Labilithrix sp.]
MNRILVALDHTPRAKEVLAAAIDLARRTQAKLRLLRCVGLPPELPANVWALPPAQVTDQLLAIAKRELDADGAGVPPELFDSATVHVGVPWDTICSVAKEDDVDLIVIGSHGYDILDRIVGTTAAKVVNHADRSVLVVRPKGGGKKS